jgi:hypothetical protein
VRVAYLVPAVGCLANQQAASSDVDRDAIANGAREVVYIAACIANGDSQVDAARDIVHVGAGGNINTALAGWCHEAYAEYAARKIVDADRAATGVGVLGINNDGRDGNYQQCCECVPWIASCSVHDLSLLKCSLPRVLCAAMNGL